MNARSQRTGREIRILDDNASAWRRQLLDDAERWELHAERYSHEPAIHGQSLALAARCREAAKHFDIKEGADAG